MNLRTGWVVAGLVFGGTAATAQSTPDSTTTAAVATYTTSQARRGQSTYQRNCIECHTAAAYTGIAFRRAWAGRSPFALWELIRTTMPQDNPGRLKPSEYADIVAYMLRLNGYPAGDEELPAEADKLQSLIIPRTPPAGSP